MKMLHILLLSVAVISGCKKSMSTGTVAKPDTLKSIAPDTGVYHYLALGDSYTIGQSVPSNEAYPFQLTNAIKRRGLILTSPYNHRHNRLDNG